MDRVRTPHDPDAAARWAATIAEWLHPTIGTYSLADAYLCVAAIDPDDNRGAPEYWWSGIQAPQANTLTAPLKRTTTVPITNHRQILVFADDSLLVLTRIGRHWQCFPRVYHLARRTGPSIHQESQNPPTSAVREALGGPNRDALRTALDHAIHPDHAPARCTMPWTGRSSYYDTDMPAWEPTNAWLADLLAAHAVPADQSAFLMAAIPLGGGVWVPPSLTFQHSAHSARLTPLQAAINTVLAYAPIQAYTDLVERPAIDIVRGQATSGQALLHVVTPARTTSAHHHLSHLQDWHTRLARAQQQAQTGQPHQQAWAR